MYPAENDQFISATIFQNRGNNMFEMNINEQLYEVLFAPEHDFPKPTNPLAVIIGANIGESAFGMDVWLLA